jgi:hypothetical protein
LGCRLKAYYDRAGTGLQELVLLLKAQERPARDPRFYRLDDRSTLAQALAGKILVWRGVCVSF